MSVSEASVRTALGVIRHGLDIADKTHDLGADQVQDIVITSMNSLAEFEDMGEDKVVAFTRRLLDRVEELLLKVVEPLP